MLEFKQNLYVAEIFLKNSDNGLIVGFGNGLQPSYNAQGGTSNGDTSKYTITLTETSQNGLEELVNWSIVNDTNKKWVYIKEIDNVWAASCIDYGVGRYDYMAEVDQDGNILGNFKRFSGASPYDFPYLNVIGTFNDEVVFETPHCACSNEYMYVFDENYYCINGNKVQALELVHTYDCGKTGKVNGTGSPISDYTKIGNVVETSSSFCNENVQYMWVLKTDKFECKEYTPSAFKYQLILNDSRTVSAECNGSISITSGEVSTQYSGSVINAIIGGCVTIIDNYAFSGCRNLTSVTMSSGVTTIGNYAFSGCTGFVNIAIQNNVINIGDYAFRDCTGLTSVTINSQTPPTLGNNALYNTNNCTIFVPCQSVDVYKSASEWSRYASRIKGIPPCDKPTFEGKYKLILNDSSVVTAACDSTSAITSSEIGYRITLSEAEIGDCVVTIGGGSFKGCYNLTGITISDSVTSIGNSAFSGCSSLPNITIPNSVTNIDQYAFNYCSSLTSINIPSGITSIEQCTFVNCYKLKEINIPDIVTNIGQYAFRRCFDLESINIPSGVTSIGDYTFDACTGLTMVNSEINGECNIPSSITSIGGRAFSFCSSFTSIIIPSGVTFIFTGAFEYCSNLQSITCLPTTPPRLVNYPFDHTNDCPIYVPAGSVETYKSASGWSTYASRIQAIP